MNPPPRGPPSAPPNLGSSSAQANLELEQKIAGVGLQSVAIDSSILADSSDEDESSDENVTDKKENAEEVPMININFALGNFDDTAIALAEGDDESDDEEKKAIMSRSKSNEDNNIRRDSSCELMEQGEEEESESDSDEEDNVDNKSRAINSIFRLDKK